MATQQQSEDVIPPSLREPVAAALEWINASQGAEYEVTGVVEEQEALNNGAGSDYEIGLVLCDGEICKCERIRIQTTHDGFNFSFSEVKRAEIPALLDPPAGIRSTWLDKQLQEYEFLLLLFYRGRW